MGSEATPDPVGTIPWSAGRWTNAPLAVAEEGADLVVTAAEGSDAWRRTSYGFTFATEHALLAGFALGTAMEVAFTADFAEQFDQAGIFIRGDETNWIKAGAEFVDGTLHLGAVVTHEFSDWSSSPLLLGSPRELTIRASRAGDAVTIRARVGGGPLSFVRLAPMDPEATFAAGPYVCAPTRAGLTVRFHRWERTAADASLH